MTLGALATLILSMPVQTSAVRSFNPSADYARLAGGSSTAKGHITAGTVLAPEGIIVSAVKIDLYGAPLRDGGWEEYGRRLGYAEIGRAKTRSLML